MKIVLKLGGSVITRKDAKDFPLDVGDIKSRADEFIRTDVVRRLGDEITEAMMESDIRIILINGAGPFGHFLVDRKMPLDVVHRSVEILNRRVVDLLSSGLELESVPPNRTCGWNGKEFSMDRMWMEVQRIIKSARVPSTYGDILSGYKIVSGDDLAVALAKLWQADKIISAIDKDGVYDRNPDVYEGAKLLKVIKGDEKIDFRNDVVDVTGGLGSKVKKFLASGVESQIVNGMVAGNVRNALCGDESIGTLVLH
jgi:isopentenyl phosphate kinase